VTEPYVRAHVRERSSAGFMGGGTFQETLRAAA
jgi:hypothetical protein